MRKAGCWRRWRNSPARLIQNCVESFLVADVDKGLHFLRSPLECFLAPPPRAVLRQGLGQQIGHQTAFFCSFCSRLRSLSSGVSISMVVRAMMFDAIKITHQMSTNMTGVPAAGLLTLLVLRLAEADRMGVDCAAESYGS